MIYFVETEEIEEQFFAGAFPDRNVAIVQGLDDVRDDAEIISIFINCYVTPAFLEAHPKLKFVTTRSMSFDHIDRPACRDRGVLVSHVPTYGETAIAEHTFALILAVARRLREFMAMAKSTERFSYEKTRGFELAEKTLGLIGVGHIGERVIELARAFRMQVIAFGIANPQDPTLNRDIPYATLDEVLRRSDVISLHAPLSSETYHILNTETFARCKPGVIVVNTARGALIDTRALRDALDSGQVAGAGLDVLQDERVLRDSVAHIISQDIVKHLRSDALAQEARDADRVRELQELMLADAVVARTNVVFTPHVGFNSLESVGRRNQQTVENIRAFLAGHPVHLVQ